ncbi:serine protease persephone-like [Anopheles darlingi]|uniref:serine protease persephone-like n=1 Tax=Anopheles darlingi TaxID=43151 RepID=UPI0021004F76|nr:serine protease persephone-like [Anopheles darlingi]XP_049541929.1 serine protease persephone-like [Anopheles darlingi]XP_049541938.1 serine protease persephone-like [Anopheles darlingi]
MLDRDRGIQPWGGLRPTGYLGPFAILIVLVRAMLATDQIVLHQDPMLYEGDACQLRNGTAGTCQPANECEWARERPWQKTELVTCSFNQSMPIVCCVRRLESRISTKRISETQCDQYPNPTGLSDHIFNGVAAQFGEFPHMAALGYGDSTGNGTTAPTTASEPPPSLFRCAASLISRHFLLTAAHCLRERPTFARLGVLELQPARVIDEPLDIGIRTAIPHPDYNPVTYRNDIALLELEQPALDWPFVDPVCLYTKPIGNGTAPLPSPLLSVQGWGTVLPGDTDPAPRLMKANITVLERDTCIGSLPRNRRNPAGLHEGQLCALGRNERNETVADTCPGDSGGPLELIVPGGRHYLVGITSNGYACGSPIPGIYTEIAHYLDWIESIVWPATTTTTTTNTTTGGQP